MWIFFFFVVINLQVLSLWSIDKQTFFPFLFYYQYFLRGISHYICVTVSFCWKASWVICCFGSMMKFHSMCDSVMFTYRLHFMKTNLYDIWFGRFILPLFVLLVVFIRLLALSVQHAVQGPTKDLKKSCISLKRLAKVSRPHIKQCCFVYS